MHNACDDPSKRVVAVKGPARSGKTIAWENFLLKVGMFGPSRNVGWYMHSEPDVKRYVLERVNWFFREHERLAEKLPKHGKPAWNFKSVEGKLWEWLAANDSTTRARSFSLAVADEIDAMRPHIRDAIVTLIRNRQKEYGSAAKILLSSHADAGPLFGIDAVLVDSDMRLRMSPCRSCANLVGFAKEIEVEHERGRRARWNIPELMKLGAGLSREDLLDMVEHEVRIICPHCEHKITNEERLDMRFDAQWVGRGQTIDRYENVQGKLIDVDTAGFVFHAFDAPFDSLGVLARPFVAATLSYQETGKDAKLKEETVKSIGETYEKEEAGSKLRAWKEVGQRLTDSGYTMKWVPRGVDFLTLFVDVQGDRFEPGVIGWSRDGESWLIDRFSEKQLEGFVDIKPAERLSDWDAVEMLLGLTYPIVGGNGMHLGIAKLGVDTGGRPGVTENARRWFAKLTNPGRVDGRPPVPTWRLSLQKGDAHHKGEFLGPSRKITHDKADREYEVPVHERTINVFEIKKLIASRMEIEEPGPHRMHLPGDIRDEQVRELCSETLVNGEWITRGRNELWDIWVGCEAMRQMLNPDDSRINWERPPAWARPFNPSQDPTQGGMAPAQSTDFLERWKQFNRRRR